HAPKQSHVAWYVVLDQMTENTQERCNAGAAADQNHRLRLALGGMVGEAAQRAFNGQQRVELVLEQTVAELSAGDAPDMQLERTRIMRRACDGEAAPPP